MSRHKCYQCGLPIPPNTHLSINTPTDDFSQKTGGEDLSAGSLQHDSRFFCCAGCLAVSQLINEVGLDKFYQYREQFQSPETQQAASLDNSADFSIYDEASIREAFVSSLPNGHLQANLYIEGIHCTACTWLIEEYLGKQEGVARVNVNSASHRCLLEWDGEQSLSKLMKDFTAIGYQPKPALNAEQLQQSQDESRGALLRLGVAGFAMVQVGMFAVALYAGALQDMTMEWQRLFRWVSALVATPVVFFSAREFFRGAFFALRVKTLTMDVPVALAIGLAYVASCWATLTNSGEVYFDSVSMFTFLLLLGRYLEMRVRHNNVSAINQLHRLLPPYAFRVEGKNFNGEKTAILLHQIQAGDHLWISEGEAIPADGVVIRGDSRVDESMLTGEAEPVAKNSGAMVSAGTFNTDGSLLVKVIASGNETRLSAIQRLMTEALHQKPLQVSRADKLAAYFVGAVLLSSVVVACVWYYIDPSRAFWVVLSVLVVTCPCAFSLATPVSITAALHRLRQMGLLVTKAHVVEALATIDTVVVDKTGTLTTGDVSLAKIELMSADCDEQTVVGIACALEQGSKHPLSNAFRASPFTCEAVDVQHIRGQGIEGTIEGIVYRLGKRSFVSKYLSAIQDIKNTKSDSIDDENFYGLQDGTLYQTEIWLGNGDHLLARFDVRDTIRSEAYPFVAAMGVQQIPVELLSGDQFAPVVSVAKQLNITTYFANLSPEEKLSRLNTLQVAGKRVLMVGDGLNDLPVLSGADVSIAMSTATDLAQVQADSVLLNNDLSVVPTTLACAKFCQVIIKQNIAWAVGYNLAALPLAAGGYIPPYLAAIGMSLSSLLVMLNATRIFHFAKSLPHRHAVSQVKPPLEASC